MLPNMQAGSMCALFIGIPVVSSVWYRVGTSYILVELNALETEGRQLFIL